jgi:hypothetical protein
LLAQELERLALLHTELLMQSQLALPIQVKLWRLHSLRGLPARCVQDCVALVFQMQQPELFTLLQ